jgi:2-succinyl-6-hydroxy-2,4-cyclohexadiene-1-carboxylate synthase
MARSWQHRRMPGRVVLIHGFTQNAACWPGVADALATGGDGAAGAAPREVLAVDAPGHGGRAGAAAGLWEAADLLATEGGPADYLGYSMGGRVALHLALAHPELVRHLILVSATPGIEDPGERAARRAADEALADELERSGDVDGFLDRWLAGPLFATLPPDRAGRDARRANTAAGLASSLRLCGTGAQDDLWPRLPEITAPVLLIAGSADTKFAGIAERMAVALPHARLALIPGAGHAAHLEQPERFVALVSRFMDGA